MALSKLSLLILLWSVGYIETAKLVCTGAFSTNNKTDLCFYYTKRAYPWTEAYHECLTRTIDGLLIQIFSVEEFNLLKNTNIDGASVFWLGANNFASIFDSKWHWLDGSIVDNSIIKWCTGSTYNTTTGAQCAAYDSTLQCVNNYLCSTLLPAPCVSVSGGINPNNKIVFISRTKIMPQRTSSSDSAYAHWWTYSLILLNWFMLFCFFLYLCNRFTMNKYTMVLISMIAVLSFILIIIYAILWGVQYNDIIQIPLAIVIIGCIASALIFVELFIILHDRARVQRMIACTILLSITVVLEFFLMLGLILCIAYCSAYITLGWSTLDKGISASILASFLAVVSALFYTGILYILEHDGYDRISAAKPARTNAIPLGTASAQLPHPATAPTPAQISAPAVVPHRPSMVDAHGNINRTSHTAALKKNEQVDRSTSPVDERILKEFYADRAKDVHQYSLEGKQYIVYAGTNLTDIDSFRKDLTQAMLLQESQGLTEAIDRAKSSVHASNLVDEINQAQNLASKLP